MPEPSPVKYQTHISELEHFAGTHYLEVPQEIIQKLGGKINLRVICTINDSISFQTGLMALGLGSAYITVNNKRLKQLRVKLGDNVLVSLREDTSEYGMEMPEELNELLAQDSEGKDRFKKLPLSKQRYIINYVSQVKSSQLRIDRALLLIGNLKTLALGKESFREMLGLSKRLV